MANTQSIGIQKKRLITPNAHNIDLGLNFLIIFISFFDAVRTIDIGLRGQFKTWDIAISNPSATYCFKFWPTDMVFSCPIVSGAYMKKHFKAHTISMHQHTNLNQYTKKRLIPIKRLMPNTCFFQVHIIFSPFSMPYNIARTVPNMRCNDFK